jgi:hypothetical protein
MQWPRLGQGSCQTQMRRISSFLQLQKSHICSRGQNIVSALAPSWCVAGRLAPPLSELNRAVKSSPVEGHMWRHSQLITQVHFFTLESRQVTRCRRKQQLSTESTLTCWLDGPVAHLRTVIPDYGALTELHPEVVIRLHRYVPSTHGVANRPWTAWHWRWICAVSSRRSCCRYCCVLPFRTLERAGMLSGATEF